MERALFVGIVAIGAGVGFLLTLAATILTHFFWTPVSLGWFFVWLVAGAAGGASLLITVLVILRFAEFVRDWLHPPHELERRMRLGAIGVAALYGVGVGSLGVVFFHYAAARLSLPQALLAVAACAALFALVLPAWSFFRRRQD